MFFFDVCLPASMDLWGPVVQGVEVKTGPVKWLSWGTLAQCVLLV